MVGELREETRAGWSAVDEDRVIAVPDRDRVALSDVERNHARRQRMPLRDRRDGRNGDGKRHQHRAHAALRKGEREKRRAESDDHARERRCGEDTGEIRADVVDRTARVVQHADRDHQLRARHDAGGDGDNEHRRDERREKQRRDRAAEGILVEVEEREWREGQLGRGSVGEPAAMKERIGDEDQRARSGERELKAGVGQIRQARQSGGSAPQHTEGSGMTSDA